MLLGTLQKNTRMSTCFLEESPKTPKNRRVPKNIQEIQPVDMFPFINHVECVAVLELKKSIEK